MSMFNITEQLNGSFEELMIEIRAMRRELERLRKAVEATPTVPAKPVRPKRTAQPSRHRTTAA